MSRPSRWSRRAATELSTPPERATRVLGRVDMGWKAVRTGGGLSTGCREGRAEGRLAWRIGSFSFLILFLHPGRSGGEKEKDKEEERKKGGGPVGVAAECGATSLLSARWHAE